jgi:hypothetical protein
VTCQAGHAHAQVLVNVAPGHRPIQTDAQWDADHAHDCDAPESATVPQPGRSSLAPSTENSDSADTGQPSVVPANAFAADHTQRLQVARPAMATVGKPAALGTAVLRKTGAAGATRAALFQPPPPILEGGSPGTFSSATSNSPVNAVGSPRFAARETAQASATKAKNIFASSNYEFSAPVLSLPGRGIGVSLALVYNSQLWGQDSTGGQMLFNMDNTWPLPGWSLGYGRLEANFNNTGVGNLSGDAADYPGDYLLIQPDATRVVLHGVWDGSTWQYQSTDGSLITANVITNVRVRYPDGTIVNFEQQNHKLLPGNITTRNGDELTIQYKGRNPPSFPSHFAINYIVDSLGRSISFHYYGDSGFNADTTSHPSGALAEISVVDHVISRGNNWGEVFHSGDEYL